MTDLFVTDALTLPSAELAWTAVRAGGPGGQNVNKVATKIELRFDLPGSVVLGAAVRARLATLARGRLDAEGRVLITCDETRSQLQNLERPARGSSSSCVWRSSDRRRGGRRDRAARRTSGGSPRSGWQAKRKRAAALATIEPCAR